MDLAFHAPLLLPITMEASVFLVLLQAHGFRTVNADLAPQATLCLSMDLVFRVPVSLLSTMELLARLVLLHFLNFLTENANHVLVMLLTGMDHLVMHVI